MLLKITSTTMNKILFSLLLLLTATTAVWAQVPQQISYQSVIRDGNNKVLAASTVGIKISLLQGSATGSAVYVETHRKSTNANGLVSLEIGTGTVLSGSFASINWANGPYLIKTETDPTGGTNYGIAGIAPLNSVPYALYAANGTPGPKGDKGDTGATGLQGIQGAPGATGATGVAGADGKTVSNGTSNPVSGTGVNGDFYINTATNTLFGPKANGAWPSGVSLVGPTGATGTQGIQGATSATGVAGVAGADGKSVRNGTSDPVSGTGVDGDFYINTAANTLFGPKANGAWPSGVSLVGATGAQGIQGATGAAGAAGPKGDPGATGPQGPIGLTGQATTPNLEAVLAINNGANNLQIKNLTNPTAAQDAVTKQYVDLLQAQITELQNLITSPVPQNGLVAWYPFNGNVNDESGNGNNGQLTNASLTSDRNNLQNNAFKFDHIGASFGQLSKEIYIPHKTTLNQEKISVSVWVNPKSYFWTGNPSDPNSAIVYRFENGYSNPNGQVWGIRYNASNFGAFILGASNDNNQQSSDLRQSTPLELGKWANITFTFDGSSFKLYYNGALVKETTTTLVLNKVGNSGISVGVSRQANGFWYQANADIDDIAIWNRALTAVEILRIYQGKRF
jgi:hypothetical protein